MDDRKNAIESLRQEFKDNQKILTALGDENRQHMILELMNIGKPEGVRVGEITQKTHLSRPAVSHHLQILKDAGVLSVRKEGTKNYYYFDTESLSFKNLYAMFNHAYTIFKDIPTIKEDE